MGFDNECILNIQTLPGEYFCPVCRTLIYPNEALQSQCTHLYCKPCLAYVVATTQACPYDGYLVTEADSKPLIESNKPLADTIGQVAVYCLYHRSGCQWQGTLSECLTHCTGCTFGDSPVVCNRCGTQIIHRQVQEHAQTCPALQAQTQQVESAQPQASMAPNQAAVQDSSASASSVPPTPASSTAPTPASSAAPTATTATAAAATSTATPTSDVATPATVPAVAPAVSGQGQTQAVAQAPTPEQWYQQQQQLQYQQYYQQYPGYNPYQQQYQQYGQYQQQAYPQYPQPQMHTAPQHVVQGQQQPLMYAGPQHHPQPQPQPQIQPQPLPHPQPLSQPQVQPQLQQQPHSQAALVQMQQQHPPQAQQQPHSHPQPHPHAAQVPQLPAQQAHTPQLHPQLHPHAHPLPHAQGAGQQFSQLPPQPQPHPQVQPFQQLPGPQNQQPLLPQQHVQPHPQHQPHPQPQPQAHPQPHPHPHVQQPLMHPQPHPQPQPHPHPQAQPQPQPQPPLHGQAQPPPAHAVTGHQSYPQPQSLQQIPPTGPLNMHPQQQAVPHQHPQYPVPVLNQVPPQQPAQIRPPHGHLQMPVQQQSSMPPPPHHTTIPPQQQPHQLVHQNQHVQQVPHHPGVRPQGPHQGFPQQQAQGHLYPSQPHQQGVPLSQQLMHPQQSVRAQGLPYMQQQIPGQTHLQQNVPPVAQGMPMRQAQAAAGRPTVMVSQGVPQQPLHQSPGGPAKLMQSGLYPGSMQPSHLPYSGNQGVSAPDKVSHSAELEGVKVHENTEGKEANNVKRAETQGAKIADLKILDLKFKSEGEQVIRDVRDADAQPDFDRKDTLESAHLEGKCLESHVKDENVEVLETKQVKTEGVTDAPDKITESPQVRKHAQEVGGKDIISLEGESGKKSDVRAEGDDARISLNADGTVKSSQKEALVSDSEKKNQNVINKDDAKMYAQQIPAPGGLDRGQIQQSSLNAIPTHEKAFSQYVHHDKNPAHFAEHASGSNVPQGMAPVSSIPGQERWLPQRVPYGHHPNMLDAAQRPPASDRMLQHMPHPGPIQESGFQGRPLQQTQMHGQSIAPGQVRPHGQNFPNIYPQQGQPSVASQPLQPVPGQPSYGSYRSEMPPPGLAGPSQVMPPLGQNQNHMPLPHAGVGRPNGEALMRPAMGGPPPGVSEHQAGRLYLVNTLESETSAAKRPSFLDARQPQPPGVQSNLAKANGIPGKGPAVGGLHDSAFAHGLVENRIRPLPEERYGSMAEDGLRAAQVERPRPFAVDPSRRPVNLNELEEDLKKFPRPDGEGLANIDGFVSSSRPLDRGSQQFGLDTFPRPFDRAPTGPVGGPNAPPSRPLLPYQSAGPFAASGAGPESYPSEIGERHRSVGFHEDPGRKHDPGFAHHDLLRPVPEFGPQHMDYLPPLRSPHREYPGLPANRFGLVSQSHMEDLDGRETRGFVERLRASKLPSGSSGSSFHDGMPSAPVSGALQGHFLRGIPDGPGSLRMVEQLGSGNFSRSTRNDPDGPDIPRMHLRHGDPLGHGSSINTRGSELSGARNLPFWEGESLGQGQLLRGDPTDLAGFKMPGRIHSGDPGFDPSYPTHGFPSEVGHFSSVSLQGGLDVYEFSRRKKPGSMGWCRICRIDCETVEGLDMHMQTREHQKMAMDMVLSIKQETAKKQRISEGNVSLEETNKSRKASFGHRGNRQ